MGNCNKTTCPLPVLLCEMCIMDELSFRYLQANYFTLPYPSTTQTNQGDSLKKLVPETCENSVTLCCASFFWYHITSHICSRGCRGIRGSSLQNQSILITRLYYNKKSCNKHQQKTLTFNPNPTLYIDKLNWKITVYMNE